MLDSRFVLLGAHQEHPGSGPGRAGPCRAEHPNPCSDLCSQYRAGFSIRLTLVLACAASRFNSKTTRTDARSPVRPSMMSGSGSAVTPRVRPARPRNSQRPGKATKRFWQGGEGTAILRLIPDPPPSISAAALQYTKRAPHPGIQTVSSERAC